MIDLFDEFEETIQEDKQEEDKQEEDDDIERMIEEQEEYDELAYMVSFKYGLTLPENIKDENLEKIKHLVYDSHYMDFEEEKHQIESLIMDATDASEQEEVKQEAIDFNTEKEETIQEANAIAQVAQEESIQEDKQEYKEIEYNFKQYLKSIIAIQNLAIEESDDCLSFVFTIKKDDLMTFTPPKTYSSYEHSVKIKKGQEEAKKHGRKPGLKKGSKRERADKQPLIEQIKKLSSSFNGNMNNHELAKLLNCSLNRICNYKKEIKSSLKNSN